MTTEIRTDHASDPGVDAADVDTGIDTGIDTDERSVEATIDEPAVPGEQVVEVRRRAGLAVLLGAGASLVAIAYLARAVSSGGFLDWVLCLVLGLVGVGNLAALLDARTPLLVADDLGVRLRLGRTWVGLPWGGLDLVEHRPRRDWWRDGLLVLRPRYVNRVLEDLDNSARRTARLNRRLHRAPLAVPLGLATRVIGADRDLSAALQGLAGERTAVVEPVAAAIHVPAEDIAEDIAEETAQETAEEIALDAADQHEDAAVEPAPWVETEPVDPDDEHPQHHLRDPRPALARLIGDLAARLDRRRTDDDPDVDDLADGADDGVDDEADDEPDQAPGLVASQTPEPARATVSAARADVRHEQRIDLSGLEPRNEENLGEETQLWSDLHLLDDEDEDPRLLIDAFDQPAVDPVIGPQFASARERLGLSVDQLADRTRVRPHVIESIEVDDFSACGGDFYARGHLRTLARVLGIDVAPLLETYDDRYADAPIDPRRVFEAELAGAGSIRATRGGPNWSVLVAAVMALILCWSVARLLTDGPANLPDRAVLSGSGGPNHASAPAAKPVPVVLEAAGGGARVVVRNGLGTVVFSGDLSFGQSHALQVSPPIRVQSTDGAVRVSVAGHDRGAMGPSGSPASASYVVRR